MDKCTISTIHTTYIYFVPCQPAGHVVRVSSWEGQTSRGPDPLASPTANRHPRNGLFSVPDTFRFAASGMDGSLCETEIYISSELFTLLCSILPEYCVSLSLQRRR